MAKPDAGRDEASLNIEKCMKQISRMGSIVI